jgi:hypothetical protein
MVQERPRYLFSLGQESMEKGTSSAEKFSRTLCGRGLFGMSVNDSCSLTNALDRSICGSLGAVIILPCAPAVSVILDLFALSASNRGGQCRLIVHEGGGAVMHTGVI